MRVIVNPIQATYHFVDFAVRTIGEQLTQIIREIWQRVSRAYHEPSRQVFKLNLPHHPWLNIYPREFKKIPWPRALDNAWGPLFANPNDLDYAAQVVEPNEKVTAMHAVTLGDNWKGLYRLIADDGVVGANDIRGQSPVYWAAYQGNLKALTILKIFGGDLHGKDFRGKTPLRAAVKYGHGNVVEFLASHKVNLNEVDGRGLTPLHLAAYRGNFFIYEKLILLGADRTIQDPLGRTAEEILKMKYAEMYHNRWFIGRLFSSPTPPELCFRPWKIENLAAKAIVA